MDYKTLKIQSDTIRDVIDELLVTEPDSLTSQELLDLTHQLDSLFIEHIKKLG